MNLELVVRHIGFGERCHSCGQVRETTRLTLKKGEELLQMFLICDSCMDTGKVISFEVKQQSTMSKSTRKRQIKVSRKLEKKLAAEVGGRTQPGSGNVRGSGGDVRIFGDWRMEHKYTRSVLGYRLETQDLDAVIRHANMAVEKPVMIIHFTRLDREFAVLPKETFLELMEELREKTQDDS